MNEVAATRKHIMKVIDSGSRLSEMAKYVAKNGKCFRALLMILSYKTVGGTDVKKIIPLASAYELVHAATLVHDDITDRSPMRRGRETLNKFYGDSKAMLVGDFLFTKGYGECAPYGEEIISISADTCAGLSEGQMMEIENIGNLKLSEKEYLKIINKKTAAFISAAAKVGALAGGGDRKDVNSLAAYGLNLGMVFQITDDLLDIVGEEKITGTPRGLDIMQGNITLPVIYALRRSERLKRIMKERKKKHVAEAIDIIKEISVGYTKKVARKFAEKAKKSVKHLSNRSPLEKLVDDMVNRKK